MFISKIRIINFRSLVDAEIEINRYTALVGLNDTGKSNVLRALNLFFNGQTDPGQPLNFARDFSQQAKLIAKKAKQITIEIELQPPSNYADKGSVVWRKTYREDRDGPVSDDLYRADGNEFSRNSRVVYWIRQLAYEYVPAIRGPSFFKILKRRLYNTLANTVAPKLTSASGAFLSSLRQEVQKIETESKRLLDLNTEFSLPRDLGELFEVLDFDAADDHSRTPLQYRGDGIQNRHVPLILKFLADQRKFISKKGKPPSETIWGFEEPENNLELSKQIELALELHQYSSSVQILVSTHSPAFYGEALAADGVRIACRNQGRTTFVDNLLSESLDEHLGLMPFIQPYLKSAEQERSKLLDALRTTEREALITNRPALYVEGSTDKRIVDAAFAELGFTGCQVVAKDGLGGGVSWVVGCSVARAALIDVQHKTAALLDDDDAGVRGKKEIVDYCAAIGRPGRVRTFVVGKTNDADHVRLIKQSGIKISWGIEEVCSPSAWGHAAAKGWLLEREEVVLQNANLLSKNTSFSEILATKLPSEELRRFVEYKVNPERKSDFAKYVVSEIEMLSWVPSSLAAMLREISNYFGE